MWACALAVERQHGDRAAAFASQRVAELTAEGDGEGARVWQVIASHIEQLAPASDRGTSERSN